MNGIKKTTHRIVTLLLVTAASLGMTTPALAQADAAASQESWVTSYALVILCVGLGLFVICRPSRREKKVKKEKKE